ncbi:fibronectin type III domain-containing protein [Blastococcus sp. KM273128]|uniref:fibronectin type III domain-containing protein n=1 Tax=Blastococcus sp. KM273128 TaxID=2570314 RepID=UPI001F34022C|nr:fibronectin type III domain-containing protein [Blastococcus sp. KM273128]MCF6745031.1 fibronectin type III domain-containing protein [Blastococcus sp. KM273128]
MHLAPPSRRALGLTAVGAIAMSTTVFALGGVAQAAPAPSWSASGSGDTAPVPAGICQVHWKVTGASGGDASDGTAGALGGELEIWTLATVGDVYTLSPGSAGAVGVADGSAAAGGTNASGESSTQGGTGGSDGSGGGGAASVVQDGGSVYLLAYGGDGGGATGGAGGGDEVNVGPRPLDAWQKGPAEVPGAGSITAEGIPCAPLPPYFIGMESGDRALSLHFADMPTSGPAAAPTVGFEYTIDGGVTWLPLAADPADDTSWVTITGLTNGTAYTVQLRALGGSDTVPSEPSNPLTATPYAPVGTPTNVVVTPGSSSTTITWDAPAPVPGAAAVDSYEVVHTSGGELGGWFCGTDRDVRTCTGYLAPGREYTLRVVALGTDGLYGAPAEVTTGVIPFPATVPAANGRLQKAGAAGSTVAPGQKVTLTGAGFSPGSEVTVLVYSEPQVLATTVADGDGRISVEVTVPAGLAAGDHTLVAIGVDAAGHPYTLTLPITVSGGTTGSGGLAYTGADIAFPAIGGVAALAVGGALVLAGRRRGAAG